VDEQAAPPARRGVASSQHTVHSVVLLRPRTIWLITAMLAGLAVGWVVVGHSLDVWALLFIGIVLAEGLRPLVYGLCARRLPRPLAVLLLYGLVLAVLGLLGWILVTPLVVQVAAFVAALPHFVAQAQHLLGEAQRFLGRTPQAAAMLNALSGQVGGLAQQIPLLLVTVSLTLVGALFKFIEVLLIAFFWLTATDGLKPFVVGLLPAAAQDPAHAVLAELSHNLGGYVRGVVINMVVIGLLSGAGLAGLGVPYPVLLGVIAGLMEVLPIVGPWISGSVAVLVALATQGLLKGVEVAALFAVIQTIEGNTLVPYVMYRTTALNPLTVLLAVLAGGTLLGLVGAVLAVPVAVVLEVLVLRVLAPAARHASQRASAPPSPPAPSRRARAADAGGQRGKQPAHRAEAGAVRHGAAYDPPSSS
jgi:predicted PurR-regulated permease PerM